MSLIICVTTYNRAEMLGRQLESLRSLTSTPFLLVVCDDGSTDDSTSVASKFGAHVIRGSNRGIAFNKNRGLYFSSKVSDASHILLLDDDTFPERVGWEQDWVRAIDLHGHINYAPPIAEPYTIHGDYTPERPAVSNMLSGQCLGFDRRLLARIGYMDTRYGRYGAEHVDLTYRAIRLGYGGFLVRYNAYFLAIKGGLRVEGSVSAGTPEDIAQAGILFNQLKDDSIYRLPWHSTELYDAMMQDFAELLHVKTSTFQDEDLRRLRESLEAAAV